MPWPPGQVTPHPPPPLEHTVNKTPSPHRTKTVFVAHPPLRIISGTALSYRRYPALKSKSVWPCVNYRFCILSLQQQPIKQSFCRSLRRDTHWKCLILTVLISGCLTAIAWCRMSTVTHVVVNNFYEMPVTRTSRASPCEDGYVYIPVAFTVMLYLVYLVECWHCHTRIELQYKVDVNSVYERVQTMREALPIVWWKAICYHYVRRTRQVTRYRNGDAFTTTQVYYERINSHTASSAFNFMHCGIKDVSRKLVNLEQYPATKIHFSKGFSFACVEAEHEFEEQRGEFFQDHERRDDYMETREGLDLLNVNFKEYMIAFADPDNLPWYVSQIVFWLASVLLLSWPLRVLIEYKTAYVHFHVHKVFGGNYMDPAFCPGQMTRVSTMGSSELELSVRNNYMVPSYSEALLMDSTCPATRDRNANITPSASSYTVNGYVPLGGTTSPTMQLNSVLLGSLPVGLANGHLQSDNASGPSANGRVHSGIIRRSWSAMDQVQVLPPPQRRRGRRKRKRRRHSYTEAVQRENTDMEPNQRDSYTPTVASSPESPTEPEVPPTEPEAAATEQEAPPTEQEAPPTEQEAPSAEQQQLSARMLTTQTSEDSIVMVNDGEVVPDMLTPSTSSPPTESTTVPEIDEDPPSYEVALTMSLPPSTHSSPAREPRHIAGSPHLSDSPRLSGSPHLPGSFRYPGSARRGSSPRLSPSPGSPHLCGSPHCPGSPYSSHSNFQTGSPHYSSSHHHCSSPHCPNSPHAFSSQHCPCSPHCPGSPYSHRCLQHPSSPHLPRVNPCYSSHPGSPRLVGCARRISLTANTPSGSPQQPASTSSSVSSLSYSTELTERRTPHCERSTPFRLMETSL